MDSRDFARELNRQRGGTTSTGDGLGGLAGDAVDHIKEGLKDAGELTVATEILDAVVSQLVSRIPQLESVPPVVTRAGAALLLNALMDNYADALPLDARVMSALRGVTVRTPSAAFMPLFQDLKIFDILSSAVSGVTGALRPDEG